MFRLTLGEESKKNERSKRPTKGKGLCAAHNTRNGNLKRSCVFQNGIMPKCWIYCRHQARKGDQEKTQQTNKQMKKEKFSLNSNIKRNNTLSHKSLSVD